MKETRVFLAGPLEESEERKRLEEVRKWVKTDPTGRFISPENKEETNEAMKILLEGLEAEDSEVVILSVCLIKNLIKNNKVPEESLLKEIKKRISTLPEAFCSKGALWWIEFRSIPTEEGRIKFVEASLKKSSNPISQEEGYNWEDGLEILIAIGNKDSEKVIEGLLHDELSKGKKSDKNIIAGLELSIKLIEERSIVNQLKHLERTQKGKDLILKYGSRKFYKDSERPTWNFPGDIVEGFILDLIRMLADENESFGNEAFMEIWKSKENIRLKWMIEDILLERKVITPDMKKANRPIE